jgi:antitoxin YefM
MSEISVNYFREHLKTEVDRCINEEGVLHVTRRNGENFVVLSESNWNAIAETLYLHQTPEMIKSISKARKEPLAKATPREKLKW